MEKHARIQIRVPEELKLEAEKLLAEQYGITMSEFLRKQLEVLTGRDKPILDHTITIERKD